MLKQLVNPHKLFKGFRLSREPVNNFIAKNIILFYIYFVFMGYRQVVRLWVLVPPFGGSSPSVPDFKMKKTRDSPPI